MTETIGAVMVVGGGIGGVQSSLDLAESGFKVFLVEKSPSIGGTMAQLDKTFPTNDCSMCILSPKLVDAARHPNIELLTYSRVESVEGEEGNFRVSVKRKARHVDENRCIGCGLCAEKCPSKVGNEFDLNASYRKAIYVPFPQAVPLKYTIDRENCIYFKMKAKGKGDVCMLCTKVCEADAIDHGQEDEIREIEVGSIILSLGLSTFDPSKRPQYGYGKFANVVSSLEFERFLSASGPTGGEIIRPSDNEDAENIAFIQCVGSRDHRSNPYCSSVCCTYTIKQALIAKEHRPDLNTHIFAMDERTFGRGFEEFRIRAETEHGVKITKNSRIPIIAENEDERLQIKYMEGGGIREEEFDMVVLAVGLEPPDSAKRTAKKLGIDLNRYGFCSTTPATPLTTSRPGVFVGGVFSGPKDIPETVAQASGAAVKASAVIASERHKLVKEKEYPPETDVSGQPPRIGVFVCHCGKNIAGTIDVPGLTEYAKSLPHVVFAEDNLYTCSQDTQELIRERIRERGLNRVVVASCSPRTHEALFRETVREAGLNPYLFEMANIRDQCSWVHMGEPVPATEKAKIVLGMSVSKAVLLQPLAIGFTDTRPSSLVLGGGLAGMTAALEISQQGFEVDLVEKTDRLGGNLNELAITLRGEDPEKILEELTGRIEADGRIRVHTGVELEELGGHVGEFRSTLTDGQVIEHGTVVVATGGNEHVPTKYLYGGHPDVLTQLDFEQRMAEGDVAPKSVVIVHCVGARDENRIQCGRICCSKAIKTALDIKRKLPDTRVYNLFKDIRTYGFKEEYYKEAGERGVVFIRYDDENRPEVTAPDGELQIAVRDPVLGRDIVLAPDMIVLNAAVVPNRDNEGLSKKLKVPLGDDGFFLEAHVKLRPLDFATDGIYVCGLAQGPKLIDETISQAAGAAARACTIMSREHMEAGGVVSEVDPELCGGCGTCETVCPYGAIVVEWEDPSDLKAVVNDILCKGCGSCAAACPERAIDIKHFSDEQIAAQIIALTGVGD